MSDKVSCSIVLLCLGVVLSTAASAQDYNPKRGSSPGTGWVSLRDYVEEHFRTDADALASVRREFMAANNAASTAIDAALKAMDARLAQINEFRAQLSDQAATFATKDAIEPRIVSLEQRLSSISERLVALEGLTTRITINTGIIENLGNRLTVLESGGSPIAIRNETDIAKLNDRVTQIEARGAGVNQAWTITVGAIGLAGVLFGIWANYRRGTPAKR